MKVGDLVKMKYEMWWKLRHANPSKNPNRAYTDDFGIVYGVAGQGVKVFMPDGKIRVGLVSHYEIVQSV